MPDLGINQLLVYEFAPDATFEGHLTGALERTESGGALRILDALFVHSDAATGELVAVHLHGDGAGGIVAPLLDFRLDSARRRDATERVLSGHALLSDCARELHDGLEPGGALVFLLVEHAWLRGLQNAVARTGTEKQTTQFVDEASLADLAPSLAALVTDMASRGVTEDPSPPTAA